MERFTSLQNILHNYTSFTHFLMEFTFNSHSPFYWKTADCYTSMSKFITLFGLRLFSLVIMCHFEKITHNGINTVFPETNQHVLLQFSFKPSFFWKIHNFGLQQEYVNNSLIGKYLKHLFGLLYLPDYLVEAFLDYSPIFLLTKMLENLLITWSTPTLASKAHFHTDFGPHP